MREAAKNLKQSDQELAEAYCNAVLDRQFNYRITVADAVLYGLSEGRKRGLEEAAKVIEELDGCDNLLIRSAIQMAQRIRSLLK